MNILFLTSAFRGMVQRAWIELGRLNHQVRVQIAGSPKAIQTQWRSFNPISSSLPTSGGR